ncbi:MAG: carboxypeptidase-like regulatory domain-containing protein [Kofleriaceae bacterium]
MRLVLVGMLVLAACAGDLGNVGDDTCSSSLEVTPGGDVQVDTEVRVTANIQSEFGGVSSIDWRVRYNQTETITFSQNGVYEIAFTPDRTGTYEVQMTPSNSGVVCPSASTTINVIDGTLEGDVRLHVTPPLDANIPPIDRVFQLPPGTDTYSFGTVTLEMGRITDGTVGRQAYLRFLPDGQPEAIVEAYTNASGAYSARVQSTPHHIVVVPSDPAYPPQVVTTPLPGSGDAFTLSTGVAITGTVNRPNGTPLAGAKVQVFLEDEDIEVPSTISTTAANGTFTLRAIAATGGVPRVVVTPPASSGLPRLEAESGTFNFANPVVVSYGASIVTRNVNGTTVSRGGALANAKVTIVGTLAPATAGTISTGGTPAQAMGSVRVPVTADGSGVLPTALVPASDLFAVVEPANAPGDAAVVVFDTTSAVPAAIEAPAMIAVSSTVKHATTVLDGARVELVPAGALGLAGVGPTVAYANENGVASYAVAAGAIYEARFTDPSRRAAPSSFMTSNPLALDATVELSDPLAITGTLTVQNGGNRIGGAGVQILCYVDSAFACEGVERDRPIGEDASDAQGTFTVVVPQPPPSL